MRVAILSDIHGNITALQAVLADLREAAPDLVLHGGDVADGCGGPAEVIDLIRSLGWNGVMGNADEMLISPASLEAFAAQSSAPPALWDAVRDGAAATREAIGAERLDWLESLPLEMILPHLALVHASPGDCWRVPRADAADAEWRATYEHLNRPIIVFAHTHLPMVRAVAGFCIINTGSVGLPYDGDPRAAYLLLDGFRPSIRRVAYDVSQASKRLFERNRPHAKWIAEMLANGRPVQL